MRIIPQSIVLLIALAAAPCLISARQKGQATNLADEFRNGKSDGMQITIFKQKPDGSLTPVDSQYEFKEGDRWKIRVETNFRGYLYLVNFGPTGSKTVIFPNDGENNLLEPNHGQTLPKTYDFVFDNQKGDETLHVLVSRERLASLDAAIRETDGKLDQTQVGEVEQIRNDNQTDSLSVADSSEQSRDPIFKRPKNSMIVLASSRKPPAGKTRNNQVLPYTIKLKRPQN